MGYTATNTRDEVVVFSPMDWSLKQIRSAIPPHLFIKSTAKGLLYLGRDLLMAAILLYLATFIDKLSSNDKFVSLMTPFGSEVFRWMAWASYWWFQGFVLCGIWVIGHECGHGAFSDYRVINDTLGYLIHTSLFTPYFSWKISHHRHHTGHGHMELDEVYIPKTREDLGLPEEDEGQLNYSEILGDTPIYTTFYLIRQQLLAFPAYLIFNVSGRKTYRGWTNHFNPSSALFNKSQRNAVLISDLGLLIMIWIAWDMCSLYGVGAMIRYYGLPWLQVTNLFAMITYLQHTDPLAPHYRGKTWNFQRGAAATIDRNFMGWQGRFFLHNVAHFHVIHHFFPKMPFYHGAEATHYLKDLIGDQYLYSDEPAFSALWSSYTRCLFVENKGDVLFYRDKNGRAVRRAAEEYR